jgi:RsiW-degrading membrane proteinase PrsW (M82 family)
MSGGQFPNSGRPPGGQFPSYSFSSLVPVRHWARDPALRSWPVLLLVALVGVPPIALVMLNHPTEARIRDIAWIFAIYFAVAWLLLLGVIVRPQHVSRSMLAAIAGIGVVTQAPTAIFLETQLHSSTGTLADIFTIGVPEELAKAIPVVAVAWIWRRQWPFQAPRDYLFLGAVSGLVFGAAEVVHYFTDVLGSLSGNVNGLVLQDITIQYIWRFLTDPISHACWAGITGYFIGLAINGPYRKYSLSLVGIAIAAVLHGLNDWTPINGHAGWVVVTLVSVLLFLGYARAGAWVPQPAPGYGGYPPPVPGPGGLQQPASGYGGYQPPVPASGGPPPVPTSGSPQHPAPAYGAQQPAAAAPGGPGGQPAPHGGWWQAPAGSPHPAGAPYPAGAPHPVAAAPGSPHPSPTQPAAVPAAVTQPVAAPPRTAPKPWWEQ